MKNILFCNSGSLRSLDTKGLTIYCLLIRIKAPTPNALQHTVGGQGKKLRCTFNDEDGMENTDIERQSVTD